MNDAIQCLIPKVNGEIDEVTSLDRELSFIAQALS
jgi:hypothetical protein